MKIILLFSLIFQFTIAFATIDHKLWNDILSKNVSDEGLVDYQAIHENQNPLNEYLDMLSKNHPDETWSLNESKAFWINAYNAYTIKLIIDNYPVKSIKDIGGKIYKINTPWDIKFISIGDEKYDLNNIEHGILRKEFNDPRIHFAINCASISCPVLRNEAYTSEKMDNQLDEQAKRFINDPTKNTITENEIKLSKIFSWFRGDFTKTNSLVEFINKYALIKIKPTDAIDYLDYNWSLNKK